LPILLGFEQEVINFERPFDITIRDGDDLHYYDIEYMIGAEEAEVAVAVIGDNVIASGYARIKDAEVYFKHNQNAYLGFMYVAPEYRGKGVNKMILDFLKEWCITQEIKELRLDVYNDNTQALKAYEKAGFKKLMIEMRLNLDEL
jgi:GNAT superfamily N-acetyltransferase